MGLIMSSLETAASWVIVRLSDHEPLFETWEPKIIAALKTDHYKAVPIYDWLASINQQIKEGK